MPSAVRAARSHLITSTMRLQRTSRLLLLLVGGLLSTAGVAGAVRVPEGSDEILTKDQAASVTAEHVRDGLSPGPASHALPALAPRVASTTAGVPFRSIGYPTGSQPRTVTVADLNGDTYPDLIVPANGSNRTQIMYGQADGTYAPWFTGVGYSLTLIDGSFNSQRAVVADFNADGRPDIAIVHYNDGVYVWLQNPDGTFGSGGVWNARLGVSGTFNRCLVAGDVNGDSTPDLVIVSETGSLTLWLGPGSAGFWAYGGSYTTSASVSDWVVLADFNEDGRLDAAVTNDDPSNSVSVLLGSPGGYFPYFGSPTTMPVGGGPNTCTVADLNGDGHLDVAVSSWLFAPTGTLSLLFGRGDGTFQPAVTSHPYRMEDSGGAFAIAAGDVTGDANIDLVVTHEGGSTVSVLPGNGNGTFGASQVYGVGRFPMGIALADVNRDGRTDIVTSNLGGNSVQVLPADSHGGFPGAMFHIGQDTPSTFYLPDGTIATTDWYTGSLAAGDLNGDGHADLATNHPAAGTVSVALGAGDGTFAAPLDVATGPNPRSVVLKDLDSDGRLDLAVANRDNGTVSVLLGKGDGTFKAKNGFGVGKAPECLISADVNADGRPDLITANFDDNSVSVLLKNSGGGGFKSRINSDAGLGPKSVAAGDFNLDGKMDLAVADSSGGGFSLLRGNGDGTFTAPLFFYTGGGPTSINLVDAWPDGFPDVVLANTPFNQVEIWINNWWTSGTFSFWGSFFTPFEPRELTSGDIDGDGYQDLIMPARLGQSYVGYPFTPSPPNGFSRRWGFGSRGTSCVLVDANEDGKLDLITLNPGVQSVSVLLNSSGGSAGLAAGQSRSVSSRAVRDVSLSPNPFNPAATLKFAVVRPGPVRVKLYDVQGRLVKTLLNESHAEQGERVVRVDGTDSNGARLGSGVYYFRIEAGGETTSGRCVVMK